MRMTIPRSQGKQAYYDARKSRWGDMFPHESKNRPQERRIAPRIEGRGSRKLGEEEEEEEEADIRRDGPGGKNKSRKLERTKYDVISKENERNLRRERATARDADFE